MSWVSSSTPEAFTPSKASQERTTDTYRVMDKQWEDIQKKTFTNWINNQLKQKQVNPIEDINTDLASGEKLIQLLEIIGDENLGKYNKNPRLRIQKVENMNKALDFIRRRGVNLTNIGAEDIVDSNNKLILGLIWTIILRFTISEISEEGLSAKEGLLLWCQRRTVPYASDFFIKDFTFSWQDGLALCALIHRHRPDLLDYYALKKKDRHANTQLAFDIAEQKLGIPKLFGVEDIVDVAKPDERSVMTYVAQYFHAFSKQDKLGTSGRRLEKFGQVMEQTWQMQNDFEKRVAALIEAIGEIQSSWQGTTLNGYAGARRQLHEFEAYKSSTKRGWVLERRELDSLLGNIQTKLKTYNLRPYSPPSGLTLQDLGVHWNGLVDTEARRKRSITAYIADTKEALKKKFAEGANHLNEKLNQISAVVVSLDGDLEEQLMTVKGLHNRMDPLRSELQDLSRVYTECEEANIEDNELTIYSVDDLSFELDVLSQSVIKISAFIENQMIARTQTDITPQQLEEFTETFRHMVKGDSNTLHRDEFHNALQAEGAAHDDAEVERIFASVSGGNDEVTFEQFINYMKQQSEDRTSADQLKAAFQTISGDKQYVTEGDMYKAGLPTQVVAYFREAMQSDGDNYDYAHYLDNAFAS